MSKWAEITACLTGIHWQTTLCNGSEQSIIICKGTSTHDCQRCGIIVCAPGGVHQYVCVKVAEGESVGLGVPILITKRWTVWRTEHQRTWFSPPDPPGLNKDQDVSTRTHLCQRASPSFNRAKSFNLKSSLYPSISSGVPLTYLKRLDLSTA